MHRWTLPIHQLATTTELPMFQFWHAHLAETLLAPRPQPPTPSAAEPHAQVDSTNSQQLATTTELPMFQFGHAHLAETLLAPRPQPPTPSAAEPHAQVEVDSP